MRRKILRTIPAVVVLVFILTTALIALAAGVVSEFQVTTDAGTQWRPKVYGNVVVSQDQRNGNAIVRYAMDKRPVEEWNVVIGGQFQLNKHWQLRTEGGIIGDRKSFLVSVNYRFQI